MANYKDRYSREELRGIGVYIITAPSGSKYVGMTGVSFGERWRAHLTALRGNRHPCQGLQRAYAKYGEEGLLFSISIGYNFDVLLDSALERRLLLLEQRKWDELKEQGANLYNGRPTGTGSVIHTDETKIALLISIRERQLKLYEDLINNEAMLLELFDNEDLTWTGIARELNTTVKHLKRYLTFREDHLGLDRPTAPTRDARHDTSLAMKYMNKHNLTRNQFNDAVKAHWKENHSKTATAEHFGITIKEVSFICNESGRAPGLQRTHVKFHEKLDRMYSDCLYCLDTGREINVVVPTEEELRRLYVEKGRSVASIAAEYNVTKAKVQQLLYTYGIRRE